MGHFLPRIELSSSCFRLHQLRNTCHGHNLCGWFSIATPLAGGEGADEMIRSVAVIRGGEIQIPERRVAPKTQCLSRLYVSTFYKWSLRVHGLGDAAILGSEVECSEVERSLRENKNAFDFLKFFLCWKSFNTYRPRQ